MSIQPRYSSPAAPSTQIQSAPNGIAIGGNNYGNPTVNKFGKPSPPERKIAPVAAQQALDLLKKAPTGSSVYLELVGSGEEPKVLALAVYDLFTRAGWRVTSRHAGQLTAMYAGEDGSTEVSHGEGFTCTEFDSRDVSASLAIEAMRALDVGMKVVHRPEDNWATPRPLNIKIVMGTRFTTE